VFETIESTFQLDVIIQRPFPEEPAEVEPLTICRSANTIEALEKSMVMIAMLFFVWEQSIPMEANIFPFFGLHTNVI
jgi:hypothetical protein